MLMKLFKKINLLKKIENLDEIIKQIGDDKTEGDQKIFEFEFFTGGKSSKFDNYIRNFGLSTDNIDALNFIQSDFCKEILKTNHLKIHIETGNIYYKNIDTNESVFEFFKNQKNSSKCKINFDFIYDGSYENYFKWILNGFDGYEKTKLDLLTFKKTKYLFYRFNDLLNQTGRNIKDIQHSVVTDDYIAAEEIQNQNWQYFIEQVLEVCEAREIGKTIKKLQDFLLDTVENFTMAKKSHEMFHNVIERNFF